jgi:hypothetical protein
MNLRHAAALALVGYLTVAAMGCTAGMTNDDPCRSEALTPVFAAWCEHNRAGSTRNALLDDYRKCVDVNVSDPTKCSAILQGLNAYSVNVGSNQNPKTNAQRGN